MKQSSPPNQSEMSDEGTEGKQKKQGGLKTMPFILGNEICDKFAMAGFNANMVSYLTSQLHLPLVQASNTLSNFSGTTSLTTIAGALISDSFAGRFWTITFGSLIYQLGMLAVTITAVLPSLRPPPCTEPQNCERASTWQLLILYASLLLTAIGAGGIRPCVVAFGADQFELHKQQQKNNQKWSFFNLYYFASGVALILALTVVVYIQDNVGWGWGFGVPTLAMFGSVLAFVAGYPLYIKFKPSGSPMTRLIQVSVAAFKKRKVQNIRDPSLLYVNKELDAEISTGGRLLHTDNFRFLDKAAIIMNEDMIESGKPNPWKLSTVHRIEELKSLIQIIPIWSVGILITTASSHNHSFVIMQAKSMDRHLTSHFQVPAASMSIFTIASMLLSLTLYDRLLVPIACKLTGKPNGLSYLQRIGIGLAISLLSNVAAAVVETKRKAIALENGKMSVFWLVPQFAIHGISEAFTMVGHMEFMYDQSPESMRSTAVAFSSLAVSFGNYLGTALVTLVSVYTTKRGNNWLQNDLNKGRLDYYYWLVTVLQVFNFGYYLVCARCYRFKTLEVEEDDVCVGDVEIAKLEQKSNGDKQ